MTKLPLISLFLLAVPLVIEAVATEKTSVTSDVTVISRTESKECAPASSTSSNSSAHKQPPSRKVPAAVAPWFM